MKKNELMNGDIVVLRSGQIAVVIGQGSDAHMLFQTGGFEFLDDYYDDDMVYDGGIDAIMQVFRPNGGFGFEGVDEEVPVYERNETWTRPNEAETVKAHEEFHAEPETSVNTHSHTPSETQDRLTIITQAFYGNRTGTEIYAESIDRFILGYQSDDLPVTEPIDRTIVHLPGSDNLVLIYNRFQEKERLDEKDSALRENNYVIKPLAIIPELNLKIYSRCIVCRMNANGALESLKENDYKIWSRYLSV